jgi:osmotically inducible protein OsmC
MIHRANATWRGDGQEAGGELSVGSWTLKAGRYSPETRLGRRAGTSPEELIAAAHASCLNMSMARRLEGAGYACAALSTEAEVSLEADDAGYRITGWALRLTASVPGLDQEAFARLAADAERDCLVSRLLNVDVAILAELA